MTITGKHEKLGTDLFPLNWYTNQTSPLMDTSFQLDLTLEAARRLFLCSDTLCYVLSFHSVLIRGKTPWSVSVSVSSVLAPRYVRASVSSSNNATFRCSKCMLTLQRETFELLVKRRSWSLGFDTANRCQRQGAFSAVASPHPRVADREEECQQ